jgi:hypothetical protein
MLKVGGGGGGPEFYKVLKYIVFRRSLKLVDFGPFVNFTKGSVSRELEIILSSVSTGKCDLFDISIVDVIFANFESIRTVEMTKLPQL